MIPTIYIAPKGQQGPPSESGELGLAIADLVNQVFLIILVAAFLVIVESLEKLANQVMMELMMDMMN